MKRRVQKGLIVLVSVSIAPLLLAGADRLVGALVSMPDETPSLLFPPFSHRSHSTSEFSYTISVNNLGFRDRDFHLDSQGDYRILAIGDSMTYGWGVNIDKTWPKVLERNLRDQGYNVEIANLGFPGGGPKRYAELAIRAIPLLTPDLVLIAVLQGDDLAQSDIRSEPTVALDINADAVIGEIGYTGKG